MYRQKGEDQLGSVKSGVLAKTETEVHEDNRANGCYWVSGSILWGL